MKINILISVVAMISMSCSSANVVETSQITATPYTNAEIDHRVDEIYNRLTMDQRAAQLHGVRPINITIDGELSLELCRKLIPHGVGHVSQYACMIALPPEKLRKFVADLQDYVMNEVGTGVPAIFHEEAITGFATLGATTYPQSIGVACMWNPELVEQKSRYTAESMRSCGGTFALSPMVDVVRTPHFNRVEESYGEDSYLSSTIGLAFVNGMQGDDLRAGVATTTKHFLGYGDGMNNTPKEIIEEILMPHEVAIKMGNSKSVMPGYHKYEGETSITSPYFIKYLLRDYLNYDGIIVSDYGAIGNENQAIKAKLDVVTYLKDRATKSLENGADLELCDGICYPLLPDMIEDGEIDIALFEQAVKRNLAMKVRLGLMDEGAELYSAGELDLNKPEYQKVAYEMAAQSIVLLKNNGILPLHKESKQRIALVGPNANSFWAMLGDYTFHAMYGFFQSGTVDPTNPKITTLKEGLESRIGADFSMGYERGCDWADEHTMANKSTGFIKEITEDGDFRIKTIKRTMKVDSSDPTDWDAAVRLGESSDIIIAAMGETTKINGEGRTRKGIRLPGEQEQFVEDMIDTGRPVVVVIFGGRAQVLSQKILDRAAAIVEAWYPGQSGGDAVADILLGNINPSGHLCVSYPAMEKRGNFCYNYGDQVDDLVAFPFGHGLSYTTFEYAAEEGSDTSVVIGEEDIEVSFTITNCGDMAGAEVAQLYVSPNDTNVAKYIKPIQLKGYQRVELAAGETKRVIFKLSPEIFAHYTDDLWCVTPGDYTIKIGSSSKDIRINFPIELQGSAHGKRDRNIFLSHSTVLN